MGAQTVIADRFDADYYLRGEELGLSLYTAYRWMPELSIPMAQSIADYLRLQKTDRILDFGCARGFLVRALRDLGYRRAEGYDHSKWALDNADPEAKRHLWRTWPTGHFDWIIAKDVLEHIPSPDLEETVMSLAAQADRGLFVVVPLSAATGAPYEAPEYERDVTHVQRLTWEDWAGLLADCAGERFQVDWRFSVKGVKDRWFEMYPQANGFFVCRRKPR